MFPVESPLLAALAVVAGGARDLVAASVWSLSDGELTAALDELTAVKARLAAAELAVVAEADRRRLGQADGAVSTARWLTARQLVHPAAATRTVGLAGALAGPCQATGAALAAGRLSEAQAHTIVTAVAGLPAVAPDVRESAEDFLITQGAVLDPLALARVGRELAERLRTAPDSDERALRQEEAGNVSRSVAADGMVHWSGWFSPEADALMCAAIDPLSAPRPAADGTPDPRSAGRRRYDALLELVRRALAADAVPHAGGLRPTVSVNVDYDVLLGRLAGAGRLAGGEIVGPEAARRLACDAGILPIVLGGAGLPLDVGRSTRTIGAGLRWALHARDEGCAFPGCDALAAWCDGHHIVHWADGGRTALDNLVLLCGRHHSVVHHQGWTVAPDRDELPTFLPPPWIDADRTPRQHHRYALRQIVLTGSDPP